MKYEEALDILKTFEIDAKFGYGGVSKEYVIRKAEILELLSDPDYDLSEGDIWLAIECNCGGYNGYWDDILLKVIKDLRSENPENIFLEGKKYQNEVEIINYILCSADICEYGTSPRFCWLTDYGKVVFNLLESVLV